MASFFASGHAADLILLILLAELMWLVLSRRLTASDAAAAIMPGLMLAVALRFALTGAAWPWIAAPLALSLPFHVVDLAKRLRSNRRD